MRIEMGALSIEGDEPASAGGEGRGPSPFDLLSASLAECTAMTVRWYARRQGWPLDHVEVIVEHSRKILANASDPIDAFDKTIVMTGPMLTSVERDKLIEIAGLCPVQRTLQGASVISTQAGTPLSEAFDR
jgi:putative redox protein